MTTMLTTTTDAGRRDGSLLTADDTYTLYLDALGMTLRWGTAATMERTGEPMDEDNPVTDWAVLIYEDDEPSKTTILRHEDIVAAMRRIAADPTIDLAGSIVAGVQSVLAAPTHDDLTDELCQLDEIGFDAIVQIAVLGEVVYG